MWDLNEADESKLTYSLTTIRLYLAMPSSTFGNTVTRTVGGNPLSQLELKRKRPATMGAASHLMEDEA